MIDGEGIIVVGSQNLIQFIMSAPHFQRNPTSCMSSPCHTGGKHIHASHSCKVSFPAEITSLLMALSARFCCSQRKWFMRTSNSGGGKATSISHCVGIQCDCTSARQTFAIKCHGLAHMPQQALFAELRVYFILGQSMEKLPLSLSSRYRTVR